MTESTLERQYSELVTAIVKVVPGIHERRNARASPVCAAIRQLIESGAEVDRMNYREIAEAIGMPEQLAGNIRWHLRVAQRPIPQYRPITLEDVLRALDGSKHKTTFNLRVCLNGQFANYYGELGASWNLGKPLSEQSPETISFLHSLLVR